MPKGRIEIENRDYEGSRLQSDRAGYYQLTVSLPMDACGIYLGAIVAVPVTFVPSSGLFGPAFITCDIRLQSLTLINAVVGVHPPQSRANLQTVISRGLWGFHVLANVQRLCDRVHHTYHMLHP
jgi:hypothetical protein